MASGAWESIILNGRRFACKNDDSVKTKLPGFENEVIVGGDGSNWLKKTRHAGSISDITVICNPKNDDFEFLNELQNSMEFFPVSGTKLDGTVYSGTMQLTDAVEHDDGENTVGLTLEGTLEKQG